MSKPPNTTPERFRELRAYYGRNLPALHGHELCVSQLEDLVAMVEERDLEIERLTSLLPALPSGKDES